MTAIVIARTASAWAATITVDTTADGVTVDGNCTLREAVIAANTDAAVDACAAGSGADVILLAAGTYTLTVAGADEDAGLTGDLDVTSAITLRGAGSSSTILGAGATGDRVIHVLSTGTATLEQLTIRDGAARFGGGLYNAGTLTLTGCVVTANTASGVAGASTGGGAAGGGGGGVFNAAGATLHLDTSSVTDNVAIGGAGQAAVRGGGGGGGGGAGGGLFNDGGTVTGSHLTMTGNTATGGTGGTGVRCGRGRAGSGGGGFTGAGGNAGSGSTSGIDALGGGGGSKGGNEGSCTAHGGNGGFASGGGGSSFQATAGGTHGGSGGAGTRCAEGRGGGGGGGGLGGAMFSQGAGSVTLTAAAITANVATQGAGGGAGGAGVAGGAGEGVGGGIYQIGNGSVTVGGSVSGNTSSTTGAETFGEVTLIVAVCGDGRVDAGEACDDGNTAAGDGCSATCTVEPGFLCVGVLVSACTTQCGDGLRAGSEACDDGNTISGDGCSATCQVESCGDGRIGAGEACDDGNHADGDGCSAACEIEATWTCTGEPSRCLRDRDGDGIADTSDNCVDVANPAQLDSDHDGIGDSCDHDTDGNGFDDTLGVRGGGCDTGGGSGLVLGLALSLALGGVAFARRRRRAAAAVTALVALLVIGGSGVARAQAPTEIRDFETERFHWTAARTGILGTESGTVLGAGVWDLGMWLGTADDSLVLSGAGGDVPLISRRSTAALVGAIGIGGRAELGVSVPIVFAQVRARTGPGISGMLAPLSSGFGDVSLSPKLAVLRQSESGVAVAFVGGLTLPTGHGDYRGERGMTFVPTVAVSRSFAELTLAGNLGWRIREQVEMADLWVDDELVAELGAAYQIDPVAGIELGWSGATSAAMPFGPNNQNHSELRGGATFRFGDALMIEAIVGVGLQHGFGTPDWRGVLAVRYGR
jgi:CSLREA domain-containing protein